MATTIESSKATRRYVNESRPSKDVFAVTAVFPEQLDINGHRYYKGNKYWGIETVEFETQSEAEAFIASQGELAPHFIGGNIVALQWDITHHQI